MGAAPLAENGRQHMKRPATHGGLAPFNKTSLGCAERILLRYDRSLNSIVTSGREPPSASNVARPCTFVVFSSRFGINSCNARNGNQPVNLEKDRACLHVADLLVGDCGRCASTFEYDRGGNLFDLRCRSFRFPKNQCQSAQGNLHCRIHDQGTTSLCQAAPDNLRSYCSTASQRLKITIPSSPGPVRVS